MADLFDIVTARKLSGGGGGGSSDFSTATMTVVINNSASGIISVASVMTEGMETTNGSVVGVDSSYHPAFTVILYKGNAIAEIKVPQGFQYTIATDGNITSVGGDFYLITGDCTITIS